MGILQGWSATVPAYDLDQPNSLMDALARKWAGLINDTGGHHIHFDGPDAIDFYPGVMRDFQTRVYSYVGTPATSSSVGGNIAANLELKFSGVRDNLQLGYWPLKVGARRDST